jgi:hypothetical protein
LTEKRPDATTAHLVVDHQERSVARRPDGGFDLEAPGLPSTHVVPDSGGWRIEGDAGMTNWRLRRARTGRGFVASDGEREIARTMSTVGMEGTAAPKNLLMDDGRLFRIQCGPPREGGFELLGWETSGAYLRARPKPDGWKLVPTAACAGIVDLRALCLLFAAEVLDAEQPPGATTDS